ncbi:MAG: hypothetical protein AB2A00_28330 [Myxococcota bacterium]
MKGLMGLLGVFSAADALWIATNRHGWARFWRGFLRSVERKPKASRGVAAVELAVGAALLATLVRQRRLGV